ncbi:glycosyltransferase [Planktosalinus lacus]|uniref:Glycosyl transferase family 2 n=1 Tax=Planktosalinus lacus TaxID=1526573 RepID=A0A8J2V9H1_9FLAO|nr:glycosyltransferase [Planktosalinus lacus]GGD87587.1 glycosyl transferase family 2 [Planktosalinus lacus]
MFSTLLIAFAIVVAINCLFYILFANFAFAKPQTPSSQAGFPVSVVICSKNEAENLKKHIPLWLEQQYPNFELILINDASIDKTLEVIEEFAATDERIKIVDVKNNEAFWANKKYALTLGIKKAKNNYLLFTDADCKPASNSWIQHMANHFSSEKQLVLGYGAYAKKSGLLNKLIRFETVLTALHYFSFAKAGMAYMGVGRNLAYTAKLFYDTNGFMSHMYIRSGDDDLFVNEAANSTNVALCATPESFTVSEPKKTWKSYITQKKRHITTASNYKPLHKILLSIIYLVNCLFWIGTVVSFVFLQWEWVATLVFFRLLIQYIIFGKTFKIFRESGLVLLLPLLEILLISFQIAIFISNIFSKPKHWK